MLAAIAGLILLVDCSATDTPTGPTDGSVVIEESGSPSDTSTPTESSPSVVEEPPDDEPATSEQFARVTRVIDGDTIEVELDGSIVDVRLIGIDTPETVHPTEPVECYGRAASRFTTNLVEAREVRLEFDIERFNRFGRTLAYVWLGTVMVNTLLVSSGYAQVSTFPPNVTSSSGRSEMREVASADSGACVRTNPSHAPTGYKVTKSGREEIRALRDEVLSKVGRAAFVDVRSPEEYRGEKLAPDHLPQEQAQVPGHIPAAQNVPWIQAANDDGTFKTAEELRKLYEENGITSDKEVIAYCRIGERSSHTWFALTELLGYRNVKNYDGSWTEYGSLVGVPVAKG